MSAPVHSKLWTRPGAKLVGAALAVSAVAVMARGPSLSASHLARLLLGVAAAAGLVFWVRRRPRTRAAFALAPRLEVAARTALSPRCSVALVDADGQSYLVAFGDGFAQIRPMHRLHASRAATGGLP